MDDPGGMGIRERADDVPEDADCVHDGERAARHAHSERLAAHERHDEVGKAYDNPCAQNGDDVRMVEPGEDHDLALEPLHGDGGGEGRAEHLDDDFAIEREFLGDEHARHPRPTDLELDCVGGLELLSQSGGEVVHCLQATTDWCSVWVRYVSLAPGDLPGSFSSTSLVW